MTVKTLYMTEASIKSSKKRDKWVKFGNHFFFHHRFRNTHTHIFLVCLYLTLSLGLLKTYNNKRDIIAFFIAENFSKPCFCSCKIFYAELYKMKLFLCTEIPLFGTQNPCLLKYFLYESSKTIVLQDEDTKRKINILDKAKKDKTRHLLCIPKWNRASVLQR